MFKFLFFIFVFKCIFLESGYCSDRQSFCLEQFCKFAKTKGITYPSKYEALEDFNRLKKMQSMLITDFVFHKFLTGKLIIILGTSSCGKTSLAKAIISSIFNNENTCYTGTDHINQKKLVKRIINSSSAEPYINNYLKSIDSDIIEKYSLFPSIIDSAIDNFEQIRSFFERISKVINRELFSPEYKQSSENFLYKLLYSEVVYPLYYGKTVVVDVISLTNIFTLMVQNLIHCRQCIIFLYCSPLKLLDRIIYRNKLAIGNKDYADVRFNFPYFQFQENYKPIACAYSSLGSLTRGQINSIHIPMPNLCVSIPHPIREWLVKLYTKTMISKNDHKKILLKSWFDLSDHNRVKLIPAQDYDIILNAEDLTICDLVEQLKHIGLQ